MSISAAIPVANLAAANATLEAAGFGPGNFSVPVYTGPIPSHAMMHAWDDTSFATAVKALPGVTWSETPGEPEARVQAVLSPINGHWGSNAPRLTGTVTPGLYADYERALWWVIQSYDTAIWPDPTVIPALVRRARIPGEVRPWVQPLDQFDAYKLLNPFTGLPDQVTHNGSTWSVTQADGAGNNIWAPGSFGWVNLTPPPPDPDPPSVAAWVQPTGGHDAYPLGARVTHNGQTWENTGSAANVWAPGVFGWVVV